MADDSDKTEPASPRKLEQAREQGQVGKSADLSSALMLLAGIGFLWFFGRQMVDLHFLAAERIFTGFNQIELRQDNLQAQAITVAFFLAKLLLPFLLLLFLVAILVNLYQVGFLFTLKPLMPDLGKLNPINGLMQKFSMRTLGVALMNLAKVILVSWVAWLVLSSDWQKIFLTTGQDLRHSLGVFSGSFFKLAFAMVLVLLVLGIADFAWQKWMFARQQMMSRQELKDEMKQYEGDPKIKQRRKQIQVQMARQRMMRDVKDADVVITNPTHLSVALKYDFSDENRKPPMVVAKGTDLLALRIREIARENGVPLVEDKWLARALYAATEVGGFIPVNLFEAVAKILSYVYDLRGRKAGARPAPAAAGRS